MSDLAPVTTLVAAAEPSTASRRPPIPVYLQVAAWAVPLLVFVQFALVAVLPLAVLIIGVLADSRARHLRVRTAPLTVAFLTPLLIWMLRTESAPSLSKDMHPVFVVLIVVAGLALLVRIYWRRALRP